VLGVLVVGLGAASLGVLPFTNTTGSTDTIPTTTDDYDDDGGSSGLTGWFFRDQDLKDDNVTVPDWEFIMIDGTNTTIGEHYGKWIVLDFMASWCPACEYQNGDMGTLYSTYGDDFYMASMTVNTGDSVEVMQNYVDDHQLTWPHGIDPGQVAADFLDVRYIPTIVFIDDTGLLRWIHEGTWRFAEMNATLYGLMYPEL
jgi:thiol-disulfide isomerase/thioredoxin